MKAGVSVSPQECRADTSSDWSCRRWAAPRAACPRPCWEHTSISWTAAPLQPAIKKERKNTEAQKSLKILEMDLLMGTLRLTFIRISQKPGQSACCSLILSWLSLAVGALLAHSWAWLFPQLFCIQTKSFPCSSGWCHPFLSFPWDIRVTMVGCWHPNLCTSFTFLQCQRGKAHSSLYTQPAEAL